VEAAMKTTLTLLTLASMAALGAGPFEKNDEQMARGMAAYEKGDFEQALTAFNEAAKQHPGDARVAYNQGLAMHKLGQQEEAKTALERALTLDKDGTLKSKSHYNLGNVLAAQNKKDEAKKAYRQALKLDPKDELARHNLEVLLKDLPPSNKNQPDGGASDAGKNAPDGGKPDAGRSDAGADAGSKDGGQSDGGASDAGPADAGRDAGQGDAGRPDGGRGDAGQGDGGSEPQNNAFRRGSAPRRRCARRKRRASTT
jgi:tetratricopeptide (TPR) repeat protein